jgi:hypothetical protein
MNYGEPMSYNLSFPTTSNRQSTGADKGFYFFKAISKSSMDLVERNNS